MFGKTMLALPGCPQRGSVGDTDLSFRVMDLPEDVILCVLRNVSQLDKACAQQACSKLQRLVKQSTSRVVINDSLAQELIGASTAGLNLPYVDEMSLKATEWILAVASDSVAKQLMSCGTILQLVNGLDLTWMDLQSSGILRSLPLAFRNLSHLSISLQQEVHLHDLGCMTSLTDLHLFDLGQMSDEQLAFLSKLHRLQSLVLHSPAGLTDACFAHMAALKQLRSLKLVRTYGLEGTGLSQLADLPSLTDLQFSNCKGVTVEGLQAVATLRSLRHLQLHVGDKYGNPLLLNQPLIRELGETLTALQSLEINSRIELDQHLPRGFANLTSLVFKEEFKFGYDETKNDLSWGWDVHSTLQHLLPLPKLTSLRLNGWIHLTSNTLHTIACQKSLVLLSLGVACDLDAKAFQPLAKLKGLRAVDAHVHGCDVVKMHKALQRVLPKVVKLSVEEVRSCNDSRLKEGEVLTPKCSDRGLARAGEYLAGSILCANGF